MSFVNVNVDGNHDTSPSPSNPMQQQEHEQQEKLEMAREHIRILSQQNEQLQSELQQLKTTTASVHQLSTYQDALAISESHKQFLQNENQTLRAENATLRMKLEQLGVNLESLGLATTDAGVHAATGAASSSSDNGMNHNGDILSMEHHHIMGDHPPPPPSLDITTEEALAAMEHVHDHQHPHDDDEDEEEEEDDMKGMVGLSSNSRAEEKWESQLALLEKYKQEHGNCLVPTNTELGRWLSRQRNSYMNHALKEDRRRRLEEIDSTCLGERVTDLKTAHPLPSYHLQEDGMMDTPTAVNGVTIKSKTKYNQEYEGKLHEKWNVFFSQLVDFKNKTGHANFPTMHGSLGRWISRQRTLYRQSKLKADRYEKLKDIGFMFEDATADEFQNKNDKAWLDMFRQLEEHKQNKGHCFDIPESSKLGKWLYRQRWMYRKGNLRDDRAEKLLAIGFEERKYDHASTGKASESAKKLSSSSTTEWQESARKKRRRNSKTDEDTQATVGEEAAV